MNTAPDPVPARVNVDPHPPARTDREVRLEYLLPHEIAEALAENPIVYLPLGSIEFHGAHLPVGLDGLNAHGVCRLAALDTGGIVWPTLFYGLGGGHTDYPWTVMASSADTLRSLLRTTFSRLSDFGVRTVVLFTGHFADEQLELIDTACAEWNQSGHGVTTLALAINRSTASVPPDHAGIFETSVLIALRPDRVQLRRLPDLTTVPSQDPDGNVLGPHRHDPSHPLWGVFGPDPRTLDPDTGHTLLRELVAWTVVQVERRTDGPVPATTAERP